MANMNKTETVRARIEPHVKAETEAIFTELGLSPSQAINLFYNQVRHNHGLPFEVKIPNALTQKTLEESLEGKNLHEYSSLDDVIKEIE